MGERARFFNAYGPTEATVCASIGECKAGGERRPSIGRPIANTRLYILDGQMNPTAGGSAGRVVHSGSGAGEGLSGKSRN